VLVIIEDNFAGEYYISTLDAHIRTTFSHNVKTVRKGRFQFQGVKWTNVDFNFVISQLHTRYLPMATRCC